GAQIVSCLLDTAFGEMQLDRVDLYVLEFSLAAIRLYEGLGFKTEGHVVEARRAGGKYWNAYYMTMLKEQWLGRSVE
ncbi:MAG TPA: GNAT family protein, partial [Thermoleophilia bacterium]